LNTLSMDIAEQTYLGQILFEPELIKEAKVTEDMFETIEHKVIFKNMKAIADSEKPLDIGALMIKMYENRDMDIVQNRRESGSGYLTELAGSVPTTENFRFYGERIINAYRIRESKRFASQIMNLQGIEDDEQALREYLGAIEKVLETGVERKSNLKETLVKIYDRLESGGSVGTPTGFAEYDRMTLGFHPTDLIIIAARPSMGKTAFALNVADNQIEEVDPNTGDYKNHVHIFSLEMSEDQLVQRMLGSYGRINAQNIRTAELTDEDWGKLSQAMGRFSNLTNLDIHDDPIQTVPSIRAKVKAAKREFPHRQHIVLIDYLQLLTYHGKPTGNKTQEVGDISKALKLMAKELKVPVCALSQLSRGVEQRQDKRPVMSDIRESGNIEQDADVITFLYRDDYYDRESENKNIIELITAKQRNGPVGTVQVAFIKEYGAFVNLETRYGAPA
jgi:replicative DNA helicase